MLNGIDLINRMRASASLDYQDRIPQASRDNLMEIGNLLSSIEYEPYRNEFNGLLVKVALTIFTYRAYNNPLKVLKKGTLNIGETIEEIAFGLVKGTSFDPEGKTPLKRVLPKTFNFYHAHIFETQYTTSISRRQIKTAFRSEESLSRFIEVQIATLYNSFEVDDFIATKNAFGNMIPNAYPVECTKPHDEVTAKAFVKALRKMVMKLTYPSTDYTPVGNPSWTPTERQVLLIDSDVLAEISVEVLASAFNRSDVDFTTRIIAVDGFGTFNEKMKHVYMKKHEGTSLVEQDGSAFAMLIDDEGALFYTMEMYMDNDHNGQGSFDTYYLNYKANYAISLARNIVAFVNIAPIKIKTIGQIFTTTLGPCDSSNYLIDGGLGRCKNMYLEDVSATNNWCCLITIYYDGKILPPSGTCYYTVLDKEGNELKARATIAHNREGQVEIGDGNLAGIDTEKIDTILIEYQA